MDSTFNNVIADNITTEELNSGNLVVRGAARFVNPIYARLNDTKNIHDSTTTSSVSNSDYIFISSNGALKKILYSDLVTDLSTKISITIADSEGVAY